MSLNLINCSIKIILSLFLTGLVAFIHSSEAFSKSVTYKIKKQNTNGLSLHGGAEFSLPKGILDKGVEFTFKKKQINKLEDLGKDPWIGKAEISGAELCNSYVKATRIKSHANEDEYLVFGNVQDVSHLDTENIFIWASEEEIFKSMLSDYLIKNSLTLKTNVMINNRCLTVVDHDVFETLEFELDTDKGKFTGHFFNDTLNVQPKGFHADYQTTATLEVYEKNKIDGTIVSVDVPNLKGDGTLTKEGFFVKDSPVQYDHIFDGYSKLTRDFDKVSLFHNTEKHMNYFKGIGFSEYTGKPLEIVLAKTGCCNGSYTPSTSTSNPTIEIDKGSASNSLNNLATDEDVVSHEIGHHVIYEYIYNIGYDPESRILHEGIADFFVHARTGDGCLGESICVYKDDSTGHICEKPPVIIDGPGCLRHAEISFKYNDAKYKDNMPYHVQSQVISAMLYNFMSAIGKTDAEKLVYEALSLVPPNSNFETFLLALFHTDLNKYNGKYREDLRAAADDQGFDSYTSQIPLSLGEELPAIEDVIIDQNNEEVITKTESSSSKKPWWALGCSIALNSHTARSSNSLAGILVLLILLAPAVFSKYTKY